MSNQQKTKKEQPKAPIIGPGAILKAARENSGLSKADIARKIHLKLVNIETIEADDYDPSISLTFTKGYLKLYAKQVGVAEKEVLDAFAALNVEQKDPAKLQSFSKRVAKQTNDDRLMMITYLIIAAVVALVVIWWLQQDNSESANVPVSEPAPTVSTSQANQVPASQDDAEEAFDEATPDDLIVSAQIAEEQAQDIVDANQGLVDSTQELTSTTQDLPSLDAEAVTLDESQQADVESLLSDPVDALGDEQSDDESEQSETTELVFTFADNCWMNLVDATGEAIAYGVKKSGRVMTVSGVAPFEVTLGAPQVVSISFDGVPVDMSRFSPGATAKFALPFSD